MSGKIKYSKNTSKVEFQRNGSMYTGYSGEPVSGESDWYTRGSDNDYYWMMEGIIDKTDPRGSIYQKCKTHT